MPGLAFMALGDIEQLRTLSADDIAMCRRAALFVCPPRVADTDQRTSLEEADAVRLQEGLRRLQAWQA